VRRLLRTVIVSCAAYWRVALLVLVTTLIWCAHYDRWTLASWRIPADYQGDSLEILTRIAAAAEGDTLPLRPQIISRLGAPFGANWSAYPSSDLLLVWSIGQLARVVGVFSAANLALLFAAITSALSFYGCARWLRARWEWSFAGALLFAFTCQTFHRGLPHLFLVFSWTVPLALLACGLIARSRRLQFPGIGAAVCIATAALIGIGNPYVLFLFLQLLGWALISQWLGARRRENLITGIVAVGVAITAFLLVESHVWLFAPDTAATSPLVRNYGGTERFALKPLEFFVPPSYHRWEILGFFGRRYERWSEWRGGEAFVTYLGIVGIGALLWLAATTVRAILQRRRMPPAVLPAAWVMTFASVGGVTNIVAFFTGIVLFRATNRFSIFISAIVLLFVASRMTRWWANHRPSFVRSPALWRMGSLACAGLVAAIGVADELPQPPGIEKQQRIARRIEADRELGKMLEGRLPAGSMVFQLPVMTFPEAPPAHQLTDYEHFRPYLATHSMRFSYGSLKGRSRGRWQRDAETLPTSEFVKKLERYGFAAVYFSRSGFADRGEKLSAELNAMGRTDRVENQHGDHVVVFLQPAKQPEPPAARSLTFGRGWQSASPGEPRWAHGPAALSYYNPFSHPMERNVRLVLSGVGERNVRIKINDTQTITKSICGDRRELCLRVTLKPGFNRIDVESEEPAVRVSNQPGHLRSFALHQATVDAD
jgi:hypothetical protein